MLNVVMEKPENPPLLNKKEEFIEPFSGALYDRVYGAMPANPFLNEKVRKRQAGIDRELIKLFEYPPEELAIPKAFRNFLLRDHFIGEERRKMQNYESYAGWRQKINGFILPGYLSDQIDRFETGNAEPDDILDIVMDPMNDDQETSLESFEIGKITHPYWRRIEHVPAFREAINESVEAHGGVLFPTVLPYRSIDIIPKTSIDKRGHDTIVGFIVKYKHDIGEIHSKNGERKIKIVERQLAGYRVDEASGFRQDIIEAMENITLDRSLKNIQFDESMKEIADEESERPFYWENIHDKRFEYLLRTTGCRGFIEKAIQLDSQEAFVVPISTTIYGFNEFQDPSTKMAHVAFREPDSDDNIAFYGPVNNS